VVWTSLILVILLIILLIVPFELAFFNIDRIPIVVAIYCIIDLIFILDSFLSLVNAYERNDGFVETRITYLIRKNFNWIYITDLVSSFPIDIFMLVLQIEMERNRILQLVRFPRLFRMMKLLRLFKLFKILKY
jgi:hypothetical protein